MVYRKIYIPIWLDLLLYMSQGMPKEFTYLHSNMVRFIISDFKSFRYATNYIYIPIWLDLLYITS